MNDFKKLTLDVTKIEPAIREFADGRSVVGPVEKGLLLEYEVEGTEGQPSGLLHVYPREDGTVTLQPKVGKNQEMSLRLAQHVAERAARKTYEQRPLSIKNIPTELWGVLLEVLGESGFELEEQSLPHGVRFKVKAGGGDEVFIHHYSNGSFLMQGKPWNAYGMVVSVLSELSDDKRPLIEAQLQTYSITEITSDGLLSELEERLPAACTMLGDGVKCMFAPALAFLKLDIDLPDYSAFAHPALRGTEACIKQLLLSKGGYEVKNQEGLASYFDRDRLKSSVRLKMGCQKSIVAVENLYGLYNRHRPGLFHADGIPEMSRLVESRKEVVALIESVFHTVESSYREIALANT
ncbi:MAG: type II toxin-antitoxin system RnlA family toxin [Betaproteobacteria bacterium]|nr:type II toxin-antitoxin system RnlA family toxin [Betaproteobacteria bacterium]